MEGERTHGGKIWSSGWLTAHPEVTPKPV